MPCLHAISSLLEKDRSRRIGAIGFGSFTDNPFFRPIDFEALERKEIEPIFKPASDKTNFDATYDLEELLLEEAPLEARARRQKPREQLKDDATEQEIRAEELHKMIETLFEPFNYTTVAPERPAVTSNPLSATTTATSRSTPSSTEWPTRPVSAARTITDDTLRANITATHSPNGSPPLPTSSLAAATTTNTTSSAASAATTPAHARDPADYFPTTSATHRSSSPQHPSHPITAAVPPSFSRPMNRHRGSTRSTSMAGGVQVVLNETGSWSEMANQSSAMVTPKRDGYGAGDEEGRKGGGAERPSGMLGFLSRKRGRGHSPKARERGVLGKEGARVVISSG